MRVRHPSAGCVRGYLAIMRNIVVSGIAACALFIQATHVHAQVNAPGRFQIGLAASIGGHATHFESTYNVLGYHVSYKDDDGAATFSAPLDLQVGVSKRFSLGLCIEPGSYVDSAGTHPNRFLLISLSPRFYFINGDHFALFANLDLGASMLRIADVESGTKKYDDTYSGGHARLGVQAQYYIGNTFGLNAGLKFVAHNLKWRDRDPEDPILNAVDYGATLRTSGLQFQLGLQVKL